MASVRPLSYAARDGTKIPAYVTLPPGGSGKGLPGPRPVLFFAPAQSKKRVADWGPAGFQQRIASAWAAFMKPVSDPQSPWLRVVRGEGEAAVAATYAALLAGTVKPAEGHVLSA